MSELIKNSNILLGAQDCHYNESGSFTGDSSISLIKKFRCKYVIIGHSERRINHCEKDEIVKKKIILAKKFKISAIVCVGEPLEIRKKRIIYHLFFINWIDVYQITLMKLLLLMNLFGLLGRVKPQH